MKVRVSAWQLANRMAAAIIVMVFSSVSPQVALAQAPGTLLSAEPVVESPPGQQAWRIHYVTTNAQSRPIAVSGVVVSPREAMPARPRDVIAWTHGTWGVASRCAPSLSNGFFTATPALANMVAKGFVVVAPDYPGLGSDMPHPYLVGQDTARSVLDAIRASRSIGGAASGSRFAVWGESQGGHAALWTGMLARGYAPELTLVGTAAAAPPTDLASNFRAGSDANVRAMLAAFATYSWSRHFDVPLTTAFNQANAGIATRLAQNNCIELGKKPRLGTILGVSAIKRSLKTKDITRIEPWKSFMRANSVNSTMILGPLFIAQSVADPVVSPAITRAFAKRACRDRRPVRYLALPGGDHGNSARDSATATLEWITDRFAGRPASSDCSNL